MQRLWIGLLLLGTQAALAGVVPPSASDPRRQQALQLEQQGDLAQAAQIWKALAKESPRNPEPFAHLGLLAAREEHYPEAEANYKKALSLNPATRGLRFNLGLAYFKQGDLADALEAFQTVLKQGDAAPADLERAQVLIGMSYYGLGRYSEAAGPLLKASAANPGSLPLLLAVAHSCLWSKNTECALDATKRILAINPDSAEADMIAGEALDEKGDNAGAVEQFRAAEKANPKEPNVHFGLGYLLWAQKRYDEAIPEFRAELENDPHHNQAMIYLGDTYIQQNQFDAARKQLEDALKEKASAPLIHLDLGIAYMETGNSESAAVELDRAISMDPDNVAAHFRLARLYQSQGKREEAKAEFAKASSLNKKSDEGLMQRIADANARPDQKPKEPPDVAPDQP